MQPGAKLQPREVKLPVGEPLKLIPLPKQVTVRLLCPQKSGIVLRPDRERPQTHFRANVPFNQIGIERSGAGKVSWASAYVGEYRELPEELRSPLADGPTPELA